VVLLVVVAGGMLSDLLFAAQNFFWGLGIWVVVVVDGWLFAAVRNFWCQRYLWDLG
jgi:hypothetical protein